jgi:hypothetical protein
MTLNRGDSELSPRSSLLKKHEVSICEPSVDSRYRASLSKFAQIVRNRVLRKQTLPNVGLGDSFENNMSGISGLVLKPVEVTNGASPNIRG